MEAIGRLAGGVAHDINNLLTVIQSCVGLLEAEVSPDTVGRELLEEIHAASERAEWLTRQLLSFSRRAVVKPARFDPSALLRNAKQLLARLIGEDIVIRADLPEGLPLVMVDQGQFELAVINLALNDRDAMPNGGELTLRATSVQCSAEDLDGAPGLSPGRYVEVMVRDTGQGMTDDVRAMICEPFFTTKAAGKGTGLGLSVVHGAVVQTGGFVRVESRVGEGSTFRLLLPVTEPEVRAEARGMTPSRAARGGETLLLVEDQPDVRKVARRVLEAHGYRVHATGSGDEALAVLRDRAVHLDLLVTDLVMPGMNGRELVKLARAARGSLVVLYISGYDGGTLTRFGPPEASDAFLQKPFTANQLGQKVREVLDAASVSP